MSVRATTLLAPAFVVAIGGTLAAQSSLGQLGLTEAAARAFLFDELVSPSTDRRSAIVIAGTRAFLKLPSSARAAAATGLFAWAKSHVNTPAFTARYAEYRRGAIPPTQQYQLTVEQTVKSEIAKQLADLQESRRLVTALPAEERAAVLEQLNAAEKQLRDPEFAKQMQAQLAEERSQSSSLDAADTAKMNDRIPADPKTLFERRLREFLEATADVDFATRTISLTGGPDGIEFIDPAVRTRPWMWHEAVVVGREATAAARAAAQAWLSEIER
jgi:hypothetical protein